MKAFNATTTAYFKNQLSGKSAIEQISAVASIIDIIGDAFAFNYDSLKFLEGSKEVRSELNNLRTAYHWFSIGLIQSVIESAATGQHFDWTEIDFNSDVKDLSYDFETYAKSTTATLSLFDWFFAHDSMSGSIPEEFRWKCHEIRDFFIALLTSALDINPAVEEGTVIYPNCDEPGPDGESVYQ